MSRVHSPLAGFHPTLIGRFSPTPEASDFAQILSVAAGYGLRLTLANQFIGQLDADIRQSIFGNVSSFIIFCISPDDAKYFKHLTPEGVFLPHLPPHQAMFHIAGKWSVVKPTPEPPPPPKQNQLDMAEYVRRRVLKDYSCKSELRPDTSSEEKPDPEPTLPHGATEALGETATGAGLRPQNKRSGFKRKP